MTDVSEYTDLLLKAKQTFVQLKEIRRRIREFDESMKRELQRKQIVTMSVTSNNRMGIVRVQNRTRKLPLSHAVLEGKLKECLHERFGGDENIDKKEIETFAISIANRIWSGRRVKDETKVSLKLAP
jgi:hypothetical protein